MARGFPSYIRVTFRDDDSDSVPLELPVRRMWPVGLLTGVFFAIFAAIAVVSIVKIRWEVKDVFDLVFVAFQMFWVLGWSVGVFFLGAITALLLFYRESARLQHGSLVHVPALGPLKITCRYDLAKVQNLRLEPIAGTREARIRFDFEGRSTSIGDKMHHVDAEDIVAQIRRAMPAGEAAAATPEPEPSVAPASGPAPPKPVPAPRRSIAPSALALLVANVLPIVGLLAFGWKLSEVMVLYWAESAVIGIYTIVKMFVVDKLLALPSSMFFVGHFGGFMSAHFLFVYYLFVRGIDAGAPEPPVVDTLMQVFGPLWFALLALVVSHGVSFFVNFIRGREYESASVNTLMTVPYKRILIMHLTVLFGGWLVMLLKTPLPALVLLVVLKTAVDFRAHVREHSYP